MANLAFPQLSSGAEVQYPLRKHRIIKSTINAFADGSLLTSNLNANSEVIWQLAYRALASADQTALQAHFAACHGPLLPFIFIDPTQNMLDNSFDLRAHPWTSDPLLSVVPGAIDPSGGNSAFLLINSGQKPQAVSQYIAVPANFQYCFSVYVSASAMSSLALVRSGPSTLKSDSSVVGSAWTRLVSSGRLSDQEIGFTVSISIPAAQSVLVWAPQLEPQISPSRYRPTVAGGVYQNAHFLGNSLTFEAESPGLFSTSISIETTQLSSWQPSTM